MLRTIALWMTLGCLFAASPSQAQRGNNPDRAKSVVDSCDPVIAKRTSYEVRRLDTLHVEAVKKALRDYSFRKALGIYLTACRKDLLDWVVYIRDDSAVVQGFTKMDAQEGANSFWEQRYVWAIVFSDKPLVVPAQEKPSPPPSLISLSVPNLALDVHAEATSEKSSSGSGPDTSDLRISRRVVMHKADASVITLIKGLAKTIGIEGSAPETISDSTLYLRLQSASDDDRHPLYVAFGRFGLAENAEVELSIEPVGEKSFCARATNPVDAKTGDGTQTTPLNGKSICEAAGAHSLQHIYTNLENAKRHSFEAAVLLGVSYAGRVPTYNSSLQQQGLSDKTLANIYLAGILNMPWGWFTFPFWQGDRPKWQKTSLGIFGATNILHGTIGDELAGGISFGHLLGDGGLDIGGTLAPIQRVTSGQIVSGRQKRLLVAVDLRL